MKQAHELLQQLPDWLYNLAMENTKNYPLEPEHLCKTVSKAIAYCFSWRKSPQQLNFWMDVSAVIIDCEFKNIDIKSYTQWPKL